MTEKDNRQMEDIKKSLAKIESLLQRLPEIQAAVLIQMWQEAESARFLGVSATDLWSVASPDQR